MRSPIALCGRGMSRGRPLIIGAIVGVIVAHSAHAATLDALAEQLYRGEISTAEFDARSDLIQHPVAPMRPSHISMAIAAIGCSAPPTAGCDSRRRIASSTERAEAAE